MSIGPKKEMTPRQAARVLGVHPDTIRAWVKEALAGDHRQFTTVRVDCSRKLVRYFVDAGEVRKLASRKIEDYA